MSARSIPVASNWDPLYLGDKVDSLKVKGTSKPTPRVPCGHPGILPRVMVNFERSVDAQIILHPSLPHASPLSVEHLGGGQDAWTAPLKKAFHDRK